MAYANLMRQGLIVNGSRQPKLCLSTKVALAYCQLMAIFTYLIHQFTMNAWRLGADGMVWVRVRQRSLGDTSPLSARLPSALWFNCEGGWRRGWYPGVSGSALFSHPSFLGPGKWRSMCQIKSHSQVSFPAVMYIHWSSRCRPLLEIYKKG